MLHFFTSWDELFLSRLLMSCSTPSTQSIRSMLVTHRTNVGSYWINGLFVGSPSNRAVIAIAADTLAEYWLSRANSIRRPINVGPASQRRWPDINRATSIVFCVCRPQRQLACGWGTQSIFVMAADVIWLVGGRGCVRVFNTWLDAVHSHSPRWQQIAAYWQVYTLYNCSVSWTRFPRLSVAN